MTDDVISFSIPLIPVSKKNSQRIIRMGDGRPRILPSKKYAEYEAQVRPFIPAVGIDYACNVRMIFHMPTRRRVDLVNLEEAALDVMVKHGCLQDDNCAIVASMDGSCVVYDKDNPHTNIIITKL